MEETKMTSWGDWFAKNGSVIFEALTDIFKVLKYKKVHAEPDDDESKDALKKALTGE